MSIVWSFGLPLWLALTAHADAAEIRVDSADALYEAVAAAVPGDEIVLEAGTYRLTRTLSLAASGSPGSPITLRGEGARIESDTVEAIKLSGPYWRLVDLEMVGVCADDSACEHAVHIVGAADGAEISGCTLVDFNAQIKGNGEEIGGAYAYPDDVRIVGNDFHDTRPRQTANPVTKIDVVGGRRWQIVANRISDYEKGQGDTVSYAAFLKGNSRDGVMERNLVLCSERFSGGVRVGLSLGGGGTSPDSICEDGTCTPEHQDGTLRNNVIANCSDVGIYLNEAARTIVIGNTLYQTSGIDVRFEASSADVIGNLLDGRIRERDSGTAALTSNLEQFDLSTAFLDPASLDLRLTSDPAITAQILDMGATHASLTDDFCGVPRDATPDIGAIEYSAGEPCDTTQAHPDVDGGDTGGDSGGADDSGGDSGNSSDSGGADDSANADDTAGATDTASDGKGSGCGCDGAGGALWFGLWAGLVARRGGRERSAGGDGRYQRIRIC